VRNAAFETPNAYKRCLPGLAEERPVFTRASDEFHSGAGLSVLSVSSNVQFARSQPALDAEFSRGLRRLDDPATEACLSHAFDSLGTRAGTSRIDGHDMQITVGKLTFAPFRLGAAPAGITRQAGFTMSLAADYRLTVRGAAVNVAVTLYFDAFTFGIGRAQVSLSAWSLREPFPSQLEARLYSLLLSRAQTAGEARGSSAA
jgi:hypothetical protein